MSDMWNEPYGAIEFRGKRLMIAQQPYIGCTEEQYNDGAGYYEALALDGEGNEYMVSWPMTRPDAEDESDACDWDNYIVRSLD